MLLERRNDYAGIVNETSANDREMLIRAVIEMDEAAALELLQYLKSKKASHQIA